MQWHSKAKDGERDFTLRRRGTRDYAHSVKKRSKLAKTYTPASSEVSTATPSGTYNRNDPNQNTLNAKNGTSVDSYVYSNTLTRKNENPLRITSLVDTLDRPGSFLNAKQTGAVLYKTSLNPLAQSKVYEDDLQIQDDNEDYGTFRKGPYIIGSTNMDHVCHRRNSEEATEL